MVETGDFPFRVVSVQGTSVRVKTGAVSFDAEIRKCPGGGIRVEFPRSPFIYPEHLEQLVKLVRAHYRGEAPGRGQ